METVDAAKSSDEATAVGGGGSNEAPHMQAEDAEMADAEQQQQQHGQDPAARPDSGGRGQHYLVLCRENGLLQVSCINGFCWQPGCKKKPCRVLGPQPCRSEALR